MKTGPSICYNLVTQNSLQLKNRGLIFNFIQMNSCSVAVSTVSLQQDEGSLQLVRVRSSTSEVDQNDGNYFILKL